MAIYTYRCSHCGKVAEVIQSIKSYCEHPQVPDCGNDCPVPMERMLTPVMTNMDVAPWGAYKSPIDGEVIDSRAKRNEHMAKHGVVMYDEIKPDIERNRKAIAKQAAIQRREDIIEAVKQTSAGHKPVLEVADKAVHDFIAETS